MFAQNQYSLAIGVFLEERCSLNGHLIMRSVQSIYNLNIPREGFEDSFNQTATFRGVKTPLGQNDLCRAEEARTPEWTPVWNGSTYSVRKPRMLIEKALLMGEHGAYIITHWV